MFALSSVAPIIGAATLPGDFNGDDMVDAADYVVWRSNSGAPNESSLGGAGDGLNGVDLADYRIWRANFGVSAASTNSGTATLVPEPSAVALLLIAVGFYSAGVSRMT